MHMIMLKSCIACCAFGWVAVVDVHTQTTSKWRIQLELETSLGKALIEANGYSLFKINNEA